MQSQNKLFNNLSNLNQPFGEFDFDAASTWQQLESKIQQPKKTNYNWIYMAALLLLLIMSTTFVTIKQKSNIASVVITKPVNIVEAKHRITNMKVQKTIFPEDNKAIKYEHARANNGIAITNKNDPTATIDTTTVINKELATTIALATISAPPKKKLKVVYQSDLYDDDIVSQKPIALTKQDERKSFLKMFDNSTTIEQQDFTNTANETNTLNTKTFLGIKIKPATTAISITEN